MLTTTDRIRPAQFTYPQRIAGVAPMASFLLSLDTVGTLVDREVIVTRSACHAAPSPYELRQYGGSPQISWRASARIRISRASGRRVSMKSFSESRIVQAAAPRGRIVRSVVALAFAGLFTTACRDASGPETLTSLTV